MRLFDIYRNRLFNKVLINSPDHYGSMGIELVTDPSTENARCRCYLYGKELICHKPGVVGVLTDEQEQSLCPIALRDIVPIPKGAAESFRSMRDNLHIASHIYKDMPNKGLKEWRGLVSALMSARAHELMPVPEYKPPERPFRNAREAKAAKMKAYVKSPEGQQDRLTRKRPVRPGPSPQEEAAEAAKKARKPTVGLDKKAAKAKVASKSKSSKGVKKAVKRKSVHGTRKTVKEYDLKDLDAIRAKYDDLAALVPPGPGRKAALLKLRKQFTKDYAKVENALHRQKHTAAVRSGK
jgi:hypothetical protein